MRMTKMLKRAVLDTFRKNTTDELSACLSMFGRREWVSSYRWLDSSGLALYFLDRLKALGIAHVLPPLVLEHLENNQTANKQRIANLLAGFVAINHSFQRANITYFNVKGFTLVPVSCPDPVLRTQMNLDFVMSGKDAALCYKALAELGYSLVTYSEHMLEFAEDALKTPHLPNIYETTAPRAVKVYVVSPREGAYAAAYQQLLQRQSRTWNGVTFPVASDSDAFINQSLHIFGRISSEWTRLSWLLEYKAFVDFRRDDTAFLREVQKGAQNDPDRKIAIGIALSLIKLIFGATIPPSLEEWTIRKLDVSVHLWIQRYGEEALLADYPGTKLYLYLQNLLASSQGVKSNDGIYTLSQPPLFQPSDISKPKNLRRQYYRALATTNRKIFRMKFHFRENVRIALNDRHWKQLLSKTQMEEACNENDRHSLTPFIARLHGPPNNSKGEILIAHQTQNRLRVAFRQINSRQMWELGAITAVKIMLGALDLLLAIFLYRFVLLLQGNAQALQISILRAHLSFLGMALIVLVGFLVRMSGEVTIIRWTNTYRQNLYAHFLTSLTEGYMAVNWTTYVAYNRNDLVRHCLITAQDGAYAYQLIAEQITAAVIVGILAAGCFIMGVVPATFWLAFLGSLLLLHRIVFRKKLQGASRIREEALSKLQIGFAEMFESAKEIRVYKNFGYFRRRLVAQIGELGRNNSMLSSLPQVSRSYIEYGAMVVFTLVTIVAYLNKVAAQDLISMLVFYFIVARRMLPTVSQLLMSMGQVDGAFDNISVVARELADTRRRRETTSADVKPSAGNVLEMNKVRFSYEPGKNIVEDMTVSINYGEIVMLRGASGAGKSTVLNLITGLLQPDAGDIYVDRSRVAYVPQDVILLDDTVRANILFGFHDVSEDQISAALDVAQLLDFVKGLPMGLDTRVGDSGVLFSGGQRQRLVIARAVLRRPQLLLLDEATSSLDLENEQQVLTRLRHVMVEGAIVFVTHRAHAVFQTARVVNVREWMNDTRAETDSLSLHIDSDAVPAR